MRPLRATRLLAVLAPFALGTLGACRQDMHDQPKLEPFERSTFFADGRAMRARVPGTIARGELSRGGHYETGRVDGELAETFPIDVTVEVLARGRERYDIFCAPCHDRLGYGEGMIVKRGMKRPASLHEERLREAPPGYFFDVITNGFGAMYDFADRIEPADRWAIAAYVEALQLSQDARIADVPEAERAALEEGPR